MIESIVPDCVASAESFGDLLDEPLFPEEERVIARAVDKRRREFRTVRGCARAALAQLGHTRPPMVPGPKGAPTWPPGVVGSMTHCAGYRAAVVAPDTRLLAIGVDAEPDQPLPAGVLGSIALPAEADQLAELARTRPEICWDRMLFSAKESVYKSWFPLTGRWLGFEEAMIVLDPVGGTFTATFQIPGPTVRGEELKGFSGYWTAARELVLTSVTVDGSDPFNESR